MSEAIGSYSVEERIVGGETVWVAIRARGAEWSWLTPAEAACLGQQWVEKYSKGYDGRPRPKRNAVDRLTANQLVGRL
jgi:hypothetical protein